MTTLRTTCRPRTAGFLRTTALAFAVCAGSGAMLGEASAMPADGLAAATKQVASGVEEARYVCGPYRCAWRPGPYWGAYSGYYGYYGGPGPYYRPGGWGWGWHRWGWHRHWR